MSSKSRKTQEILNNQKTDQSKLIPWTEWSDSELNSERWDVPKNGIDGNFQDPEPRVVPPSIKPHDWKRVSNLSSNLVVFTPTITTKYPDFMKNNKHILHSEFVRWFISTMINLQHVGRDGLKLEGEPSNLSWLGESNAWQGWMYVHSMNKTGNIVSDNRPIINPNGKYIVRLFFMGFWRRFIIDDMIPVDDNDTPLLPRTENEFELWPMILSKAVMKLASLSWTNEREINNFNPISCFTGWICLPLATKCLSHNEKWELLSKNIDKEKRLNDPKTVQSKIFIFAKLSEELSDETIPGLTPFLSHVVHIDKLRDLTLESSEGRWKAYRYFDWAKKRGVIKTGTDFCLGPRCLKLTNAFEQQGEISEIAMWTDFAELSPRLDVIFIFYKPSDFEYHTRVSDQLKTTIYTTAESRLNVTASAIPRLKSQGSSSAYKFPNSLKWEKNKTSNPLLMLIDSIDTKFILIEFSSMKQKINENPYLIVENYNIFDESSTNENEPVALIKTSSTDGATILESEPGRNLYRIYFRPESNYFVRILSDTNFHIGDRFKIYDLMSVESERIATIARNIKNNITSAFSEFGKPQYAENLKRFYDSYKPDEYKNLKESKDDKIHEKFIEELLKLIKETFSKIETTEICHSLRVFFINPSINVLTESNNQQKSAQFSDHDIAAIKIQSFFRMLLVKRYKNLHLPSNPNHSEIVKNLKKLIDCFNSDKQWMSNLLTRQLITRSNFYSCENDVIKVLNIDDFKGVVKSVEPNKWLPIFRMIVNAECSGSAITAVTASLNFTTIIPRHVIRVVNNQTYEETTRFANKLSIKNYPHVDRGYTIIAYCFTDDYKSKELDWRFLITTIKGRPKFTTKLQILKTQELSNNYVPNVSNIIGKWIVKISNDSLLTLRLSTSYDLVEMIIKIFDKEDKILYETKGVSVVILPAIYLEKSINYQIATEEEEEDDNMTKKSQSNEFICTEYYVKAYVANETWPLTENEWNVVKELKTKGTVYDSRFFNNVKTLSTTSITSSSKRGIKSRLHHVDSETTILQNPLCKLRIVSEIGNKVDVIDDKRRESDIMAIKKLWNDVESGRLSTRGKELREEFLLNNNGTDKKTYLSSDSNTRTLKPFDKILSKSNITCAYVIEEEEDNKIWLKTEEDEEMLRNQRAINILDYNQSLITNIIDYETLINDQKKRYSNLLSIKEKISNDHNINSTESVNEKRDRYIAEIKSNQTTTKKTTEKTTKTVEKKNKQKKKN